MVTCPACNSKNIENTNYCAYCGTPLTPAAEETPLEDQITIIEENPPHQEFEPLPEELHPPQEEPLIQTEEAPIPPPAIISPPTNSYYPHPHLKDKGVATILEVLPGLFGFLGIGWLYAGNTAAGIVWLIGFLFWTFIATILSIATGGFGVICWLPISVGLIVISVISLNKYMRNHPETFGR